MYRVIKLYTHESAKEFRVRLKATVLPPDTASNTPTLSPIVSLKRLSYAKR